MPLALRRHGHGGKGGVGGGGGTEPNALLSWGLPRSGLNGGGYSSFGAGFSFPQGVINVANVAQVDIGEALAAALGRDGRVTVWGDNKSGEQGFGTVSETRASPIPTVLTGGVRLYEAEHLEKKKTGAKYAQPRGPIGPVMPTIVEIAISNITSYARDAQGRVLAWGNSGDRECSNGTEGLGEDPQAKLETGNFRPQRAPFWVLTGGPKQSETGFHDFGMSLVSGKAGEASAVYAYDKDTDPTWGDGSRSNVLRGVRMMTVAHKVAFFVVGDQDVYIAGSPAGTFTDSPYVVKDPALMLAPGERIEEIKAGRRAYIVRLNTGQCRIVGLNAEGRFGNGIMEGPSAKRLQATPEIAPGVPLSGVVQIGAGEYSFKALLSSGVLTTWGSNREGQQGLGLPFSAVVLRATPITSLGSSVREISCGGMERGNGTFGGDTCIARIADRTVRTWGINYDIDAGLAEHGQGTGAIGDNTFVTRAAPVKPAVSNISKVAAGQVLMIAVQEPGTPYPGSLVGSSPAPKQLRIDWRAVPGTIGTLPTWRAPEGWVVRYQRSEGDPNVLNKAGNPTQEGIHAVTLGPGTFTYLATIAEAPWTWNSATTYALGYIVSHAGDLWKSKVAGNLNHAPAEGAFWERTIAPGATAYGASTEDHEIIVLEEPVIQANPLPIGPYTKVKIVGGKALTGALITANAEGLAIVNWALPTPAEPGFYVEWQRNEVGVNAGGKPERDHFDRSPLLPGNTTSYTIDLNAWPSGHGLTTKELIVCVYGANEGSYQRRLCEATVQA